jgi:hypothetical protein
MPAIPVTWETETGGSWFEASLGKVSTRPYLENKLKNQKDSEHCSSGGVLLQGQKTHGKFLYLFLEFLQ